jgi:hypothetical protein
VALAGGGWACGLKGLEAHQPVSVSRVTLNRDQRLSTRQRFAQRLDRRPAVNEYPLRQQLSLPIEPTANANASHPPRPPTPPAGPALGLKVRGHSVFDFLH